MNKLEKEVTIKKVIVKNEDEKPRKERLRMYRTTGGRHVHGHRSGQGSRCNNGEDKGVGRHINNGRRDGDGPHNEEGCNTNPNKETSVNQRGHRYNNYRHENRNIRSSVETKLFTDKAELVKYVNDRKADDAEVEIYKIEDGLYKLVIRK